MTDRARIQVMIVDDHPVVRDGVAAVLAASGDIEVAGEARSGEEALTLFRELRPDVTLMDLKLPGLSGVETIMFLRRDFPDARFVVLTTYDYDEDIFRALEAGALAYLLKNSAREEIVETIRRVHAGQHRLPEPLAARLASHLRQRPLTHRELQVLKLVAGGASNKDIAQELGLSEGTVKTHVLNIFDKLGVEDRTAATVEAVKRGILRL
jgi:DNA-binding NarL/FixJ family response regulator